MEIAIVEYPPYPTMAIGDQVPNSGIKPLHCNKQNVFLWVLILSCRGLLVAAWGFGVNKGSLLSSFIST